MKLPIRLREKINNRIENHSFRKLTLNDDLIDFASNDYLGFSKNNNIFSKVTEAMSRHGIENGSTGSRLISGNNESFEALELELADFFHNQCALLFNSGYDANLGLLSSILQRNDLIFYDEFCHASIRDGIKLSLARSYKFKHNDLEDLKDRVKKANRTNRDTFLVIEALYSMDGDFSPLKELVNFCEENNIFLIVDEAHSSGVYGDKGEGRIVALGIQEKVFATIHTFGKAFGCHGAVVVGSEELRSYLINFSRSFIYTTSMPMHSLLAIKFALEELKITNERSRLRKNISIFRDHIKLNKLDNLFLKSESAIQSCLISGNQKVDGIAAKIRLQKFNVKSIKSPTIPEGMERLRFCIHSFNSEKEIKEVLHLLSTFV